MGRDGKRQEATGRERGRYEERRCVEQPVQPDGTAPAWAEHLSVRTAQPRILACGYLDCELGISRACRYFVTQLTDMRIRLIKLRNTCPASTSKTLPRQYQLHPNRPYSVEAWTTSPRPRLLPFAISKANQIGHRPEGTAAFPGLGPSSIARKWEHVVQIRHNRDDLIQQVVCLYQTAVERSARPGALGLRAEMEVLWEWKGIERTVGWARSGCGEILRKRKPASHGAAERKGRP